MTRAALLTTAALIVAPNLAQAEFPGLYTNYDLRVSYTDGDFVVEPYTSLSLDGTIQYTIPNSNFGVGVDSFIFGDLDNFDNREQYFNFYGFYDFGDGRISVGETHSAIDLIEMPRRVSLPERFDFFWGRGSFGSFTDVLYVEEEQLFGITYDGDFQFGQLSASAHYSDDADEVVFSAAGRFIFQEDCHILAGFEGVSDDSVDPRWWLGAGGTFGPLELEAMYRSSNAFFYDNSANFTFDAYYTPPTLDDLTIGASIVSFEDGSGDFETLFGIGAEYTAFRNFGVEGNVFTNDGDTQFSLEGFVRF